jgi:uncharacterized heparinase superfamily protein
LAGSRAFPLPGRRLALALATAGADTLAEEIRGSGIRRWRLERLRSDGFALRARDNRPPAVATSPNGDPWDRPAASRAEAVSLHRFDWLPAMLAGEADGATEALRLTLGWRRVFGRWGAFAWSGEVMARRVFNLACAGPTLAARASDAETAAIAGDLVRQGFDLLAERGFAGAAERATAAALAGAVLRGPDAARLLARALARLGPALEATLAADGAHATRRADLALELLFDLQALDDALTQKGQAAPEPVQRALASLSACVRFATLADGTLMRFHGARPCSAGVVAAARASEDAADRAPLDALGGVHRLTAPSLDVRVDAAPPPAGAWSLAARAHPLALMVQAGGKPLIESGCGRAVSAGSTLSVGAGDLDRVLTGPSARVLGARLIAADGEIEAQRHEAPGAVWLDLTHHGWARRHGVVHQRRLYLDLVAGELRGEDRLTPTAQAQGPDGRHFTPYALRFVLSPSVRALASQDGRSVLLRPEGAGGGWVLRNDTLPIILDSVPGEGRPHRVVVLSGLRRVDSGARVRWKLSPAKA